MSEKLGTSFYNIGLYTKGGILLHPGKLVRAMVDALPAVSYTHLTLPTKRIV